LRADALDWIGVRREDCEETIGYGSALPDSYPLLTSPVDVALHIAGCRVDVRPSFRADLALPGILGADVLARFRLILDRDRFRLTGHDDLPWVGVSADYDALLEQLGASLTRLSPAA